MNDELIHAAPSATDLLRTLAREGVRPPEALARVRELQAAHPAIGMELLWEEEAYDGSVHYDLLLHRAGEGTVSVSFCPERALPWPMRGVHRWREGDLVRVDETLLTVERAVANLDFIWEQAPIVERLINACLIDRELARNPIELSDEELQAAMDAFRRARGLHRAEETHRWLERRGMSIEALEDLVADEALVARLRQRVAAGRTEQYFEEHSPEFDTARIVRFEVADEVAARRTLAEIRAGQLDFYAAAERQALDGAEPRFQLMRRGESPPALAAAVFTATEGEIVGPVQTDDGYAIVRILELTPAQLDDSTRGAVERRLFEAWLEERRRAARIEWYWGNAAQTANAA